MYVKLAPLAVLLISACETTPPDDPSSLAFRMPEGSRLTLNRELEIPAGATHALLQYGKVTTVGKRNLYATSCRFDTRSFGPATIQPKEFIIRGSEDGDRQVSDGGIWSYYSEIYLDADKGAGVTTLRCERWGYNTERHSTVAEMQTALGDYFTFDFQQVTPNR